MVLLIRDVPAALATGKFSLRKVFDANVDNIVNCIFVKNSICNGRFSLALVNCLLVDLLPLIC